MLRFIIIRRQKDAISGAEWEGHQTVDIEVPGLEAILTGGGYGENGYDNRELLGVEVLPVSES